VSKKIRYHLDEHIKSAIARELRHRGINVTTTVEVQLRTKSDESQLAFASREGRVLVTHDDDFLKLAIINQNHSGIAYCHQTKRSVGQIIETLLLIYEVYTPEDMIGRVEFL
jgi:predicted nuclease of predicted toxin-antitoxin system